MEGREKGEEILTLRSWGRVWTSLLSSRDLGSLDPGSWNVLFPAGPDTVTTTT